MNNDEFRLIEDTRQQKDKHKKKHEYWDKVGVIWKRSKLLYGDYANMHNLQTVIDTKKDIQEIIQNVTKDHERFKKECSNAREDGFKLIVLIENKDGVKEINDLYKWYNPRLKIKITIINKEGKKERVAKYPRATKGPTLAKILLKMSEEYGVEFQFCTPEEAPKRIIEILKGD